MAKLSDLYVIESRLRETSDADLFRGYRKADGQAVVIKAPRGEHPGPAAIARIRHEYRVLQSLQGPGIVEIYGLESHDGGLALVLEDAGCRDLASLIADGDLDLRARLAIATSVARVLERVHGQRVVHKDLKPHHFFVDPKDVSNVTLIDFGIATQLPREAQAATAPEQLEGSLPYISPEQTGRMNRVVDCRSDLYSLGITFYELFTGELPFRTTDPLELVHCHLARVPRPPHELSLELPEVISQIVMKLTSKVAEQRYQSAAGLVHDLETCLEQLNATGKIETFSLGRADTLDELRLPAKLYGRDQELAKLRSQFDHVRRGPGALLFLAGYSGVGKSALVRELWRDFAAGAYFISGKFDYLGHSVPYAALTHACRELISWVLAEPPDTLAKIKHRLGEALGSNGQVLIDLLPQLQLLIGPQPPVVDLAAGEAQNRFESVFGAFLSALATQRRPLVLFLDDLQWADGASLNVIKTLLVSGKHQHMLLIGSYRDNEIDSMHRLTLFRQELDAARVRSESLYLGPLGLEHVNQLLSDTLLLPANELGVLAELLLKKTQGNPFFLAQFLVSLSRDGELFYARDERRWRWQLDAIDTKQTPDNVVDFMVGRLLELPTSTRSVLRMSACIGHEFDQHTLARVMELSAAEVHRHLWPALNEGLVLPLDGKYRLAGEAEVDVGSDELNARYRFCHDRVQQAAYALIEEAEAPRVHLRIGRLLLAKHGLALPSDEALFEVVDQLNRGASLIESGVERRQLAELNLRAGRKARQAAAMPPAAHYLEQVLLLAGADSWTELRDLTYPAHLVLAECQAINGNTTRAFELLDAAERHSNDASERTKARNLRTWLFTNLGRLQDACEHSVESVRLLGEELPDPSDRAALGAAIGAEFGAYQAYLGTTDVKAIAQLPPITDARRLALMETYFEAIPSAFQLNTDLMVLLVLKAVRLAAPEHSAPAFFYAQYGIVHAVVTSDHEQSYAFGKLAIELSQRVEDRATQAACHFLVATFLAPWREPMAVCFEHYRSGLKHAFETGDQIYANYNASLFVNSRLLAGAPLSELIAAGAEYRPMLQRVNDVINDGFLEVSLRAVRALTGEGESFGVMAGEHSSEAEFEQKAPPPVAGAYGATKALVRTIAGRYDEAREACEQFPPLPGLFYNVGHKFYHGLALAKSLTRLHGDEREQALESLKADLEVLESWTRNEPTNYLHRLALVLAEQAVGNGDTEEAMRLFDEAIELASDNGFLHDQALANELCGGYHLQQGRRKVAQVYLANAVYCYDRWGATGKVDSLLRDHPELGQKREPMAQVPSMTLISATRHATQIGAQATGALDLATAVRATQTIATELVLDKVVHQLMNVLLEHAGAQRGFLVMHADGELTLRASISVDPDRVETALNEAVTESDQLSSAMLHFVARTREPLVLGDATRDPYFSSDPYVTQHSPRSVLVVPMLHRAALVGLIYLENNLASGAFGSRTELLLFLAAQAASALENARLYGDLNAASERLQLANERLESQVKERTRELEKAVKDLWGEMDLAKKIQTVLLPKQTRVGDYDVAATMLAADSVGGDYYDIVETESRHWLLIGDVSGHGVTAGLIMMMIQTALRTLILAAERSGIPLTPAALLSQANTAVWENLRRVTDDQYMTVTALEMQGSTVRFSGLHQDILVHRKATNTVERVETHGTWLGILDDVEGLLEDESFQLCEGDTMLLFTDGITELSIDGKMLGTDGLLERFASAASDATEPAGIVRQLMDPIQQRRVADDVTLMVVRYAPKTVAANATG